jgi:hypothetical protein
MNTIGTRPPFSEVVGFLKNLLETVEKDSEILPAEAMVQIKFEDLEKSPVEVLKEVYRQLDLPFSIVFEDRINSFMQQNRAFRKNSFSMTDEEKSLISRELADQIKTCNYPQAI